MIFISSRGFVQYSVSFPSEMTKEKTKLSIKGVLKETWSFRPYRYLFFIELFSWLAVQVLITSIDNQLCFDNVVYIVWTRKFHFLCKICFKIGEDPAVCYISINGKIMINYCCCSNVLKIINIFWLPIWQLILRKIGKKTAFVLGAWVGQQFTNTYYFIS